MGTTRGSFIKSVQVIKLRNNFRNDYDKIRKRIKKRL